MDNTRKARVSYVEYCDFSLGIAGLWDRLRVVISSGTVSLYFNRSIASQFVGPKYVRVTGKYLSLLTLAVSFHV